MPFQYCKAVNIVHNNNKKYNRKKRPKEFQL